MNKTIDLSKLESAYYSQPVRGQVSFGTSGHRGSSTAGTFNEMHIAAISQAVCEYRKNARIKGPLFIGIDTHALSVPAFKTALEVFAANNVNTIIHEKSEYTPTPVISYLILEHNKNNPNFLSDGVIITPSHNPPEDGGFKYNPPHGGPADINVTSWIQDRANRLLDNEKTSIKRIPFKKAIQTNSVQKADFISPFVDELSHVINTDIIANSKIKIGVDPMGGAGIDFWEPISERYKFDLTVLNANVDKTFGFMPLDYDGKIRMDCSSPHAMANLLDTACKFDVAWGNDPDYDRHGIVCNGRLMNPNHFLSVAIWYLIQNRTNWKKNLKIGKTMVSSTMIDRVVADTGLTLYETPVGFKWFVKGLLDGSIAFCGEESAGATFLRKNGSVWTTDKDGFVLTLLAAEILAKTGQTPSEIYDEILIPKFGNPFYKRVDGPITEDQKTILLKLSPDSIRTTSLAGLSIVKVQTKATGNNSSLGGVKVSLSDGSWFAIRPSGTEPKMKLYIESFGGEILWKKIHDEALNLIFSP